MGRIQRLKEKRLEKAETGYIFHDKGFIANMRIKFPWTFPDISLTDSQNTRFFFDHRFTYSQKEVETIEANNAHILAISQYSVKSWHLLTKIRSMTLRTLAPIVNENYMLTK